MLVFLPQSSCGLYSEPMQLVVGGQLEREKTLGISSYKDTSPVRPWLTHMTSFNLGFLLKGPISKYCHVGG